MDLAVTARVRSAQQRYVIDDSSKVGEARRAAQTIASFEFTTETAGKVALAATELANNLLLHAGGGELLMQALGDEDGHGVEEEQVERGQDQRDEPRKTKSHSRNEHERMARRVNAGRAGRVVAGSAGW